VTEGEVLPRVSGAPAARLCVLALYRLARALYTRYGEERAHGFLNATLAEVKARGLSGMETVAFLENKRIQFEGGL